MEVCFGESSWTICQDPDVCGTLAGNMYKRCVFSLLLCGCAAGNGCREMSVLSLGLVLSAPATVEYSAKSRPHMWWITAGCRQKKMLCLTQAPTLMADAQQLLIGVESRGNEPCFWNGCYCVSSLGAVPLCVSFPAETLAQVHKQMHYTVLYSVYRVDFFPLPSWVVGSHS